MIRRILAIALATALTLMAVPMPSFAQVARGTAGTNGTISGTAYNHSGGILSGYTVRVRNVSTNAVDGTTMTSGQGKFSFSGLKAGQYVVEVVNSHGKVIALSSRITLSSANMVVSGVAITSAALVSSGSFLGSTAGILTLLGISGAVAGVTVAVTRGGSTPVASPSR